MAFARDVYTATGGQTDFTISYEYLLEEHVVVSKNGSTLTQGAGEDYIFPNETTIRLNTGATAGDVVVIERQTSQSVRLTDYTPGPLTENDLDTDSLQAFYMAQEAVDKAANALGRDSAELWDALSIRIQNVATPTASGDAVNKAYVDAIQVAASNVPTPGDPTDDNKILQASGGSFAWQDKAVTIAQITDAGSVGAAILADTTAAAVRAEIAALQDVMTTQGDLTFEGASGPERLAVGTSGYALIANGSGEPSWQEPTGWKLLTDRINLSGTETEISIDVDEGYDYMLRLVGLNVDNDNVDLDLFVDEGLGDENTAGDYSGWSGIVGSSTALTSDNSVRMAQSIGNVVGEGIRSGIIIVRTPGAANRLTTVEWNLLVLNTAGAPRTWAGHAYRTTTAGVDSFNIKPDAGGFGSGYYIVNRRRTGAFS